MSDKRSLPAISTIRYKGMFDFDGLYKMMRGWLKEREYEFFERRFKHKFRPAEGAELEINWEAERDINEYARNEIHIYFHLWNYREVEVIKDGKKQKLVSARMLVDFKPTLILDYEDLWDDTPTKRFLRTLYNKFIIRHDIEDVWEDKLWYEVNLLQQETKKHLGIESHSDVYDDMW